jgi:mRNA interferase MazF
MPKAGDVIITRVRFADNEGSKIRPALILFEELGNVVIAGISTNLRMKGVPITRSEGAAQDSVVKLNYIFTITNDTILKTVFHLSSEKKGMVFGELRKKLEALNNE